MTYANWQQAMHALVRGKIRKMVEGGLELRYEGNVMGPDMAAGRLFPALLCLADEFAQDSGMEAFGAGYFIQQDGIVVEVEKSPLASWTAPFVHYITEEAVQQHAHALEVIEQTAILLLLQTHLQNLQTPQPDGTSPPYDS